MLASFVVWFLATPLIVELDRHSIWNIRWNSVSIGCFIDSIYLCLRVFLTAYLATVFSLMVWRWLYCLCQVFFLFLPRVYARVSVLIWLSFFCFILILSVFIQHFNQYDKNQLTFVFIKSVSLPGWLVNSVLSLFLMFCTQ